MELIVFDLDGTLVDTQGILIDALNKFSDRYNFKKIDQEVIVELRNTQSVNFLKVLDISLWRAPFLLRNVQKMVGTSIGTLGLVEGMPDVLLALKKQGFILGVGTSNSKQNADLFFEKYKGKYFDFKETNISPFGKHRVLKKIAKKYGVLHEDMYYVGDETRDVVAAKKVGISSIAVTWGFNSRKILETMKPSHIVDTPSGILDFIQRK